MVSSGVRDPKPTGCRGCWLERPRTAGLRPRRGGVEVHHIVVAGFVVYAHLAEVVRRLTILPELRARCAEEVARLAPDEPLSMEALSRVGTCRTVVMEAKRFVLLVPLAFGRARRTFDCNGFEVPEGWTVWLALHLINRDPAIYADPGRFDPDRFGPGARSIGSTRPRSSRREPTHRRAISASDWSTPRS